MRTFGHHSVPAVGAIREIVFGMEDGIVSTASAVIGIAAGTQNPRIVLFSGIVIVIVEALSMAAGSFLSSKSQRQFLKGKISEERKQIEDHPETERGELREMYRERGFSDEETEILIRRITANKDLWLEEMTAKELRIGAGEFDETGKEATFMWISYTIGGALPVVPFIMFDVQTAMAAAFALSLVGLFALGYWKAKAAAINPLKSGLEMLLVASAAGVLGYVVGRVIAPIVGVPTP